MTTRRLKLGTRVAVPLQDHIGVGVLAKRWAGVPHPWYVDIDLEDPRNSWLSDEDRTYFATNYAGPYAAAEVEALNGG